MTGTLTTDQVAELFQAKHGKLYNGTVQPFRGVRVEATGYTRALGQHVARAEVFLVHHDGNKPELITSGSLYYGAGAWALYVRDGQLIGSDSRLGASLRTVKALVARERRQDAQLQLEADLRPACVMSCKALPANAVPEAHGFHPLLPADRAKLTQGSLVLAHGHGRWRVAVVTKVSRTGSVSYLFCTPSALAQFGQHNVPLTGGTTKAGDDLYGG